MRIKASCMGCSKTYTANFAKPYSFCSKKCEEQFYDTHPLMKQAREERERG